MFGGRCPRPSAATRRRHCAYRTCIGRSSITQLPTGSARVPTQPRGQHPVVLSSLRKNGRHKSKFRRDSAGKHQRPTFSACDRGRWNASPSKTTRNRGAAIAMMSASCYAAPLHSLCAESKPKLPFSVHSFSGCTLTKGSQVRKHGTPAQAYGSRRCILT